MPKDDRIIKMTPKSKGAGNIVDLPPQSDPEPHTERMDSARADGWANLITAIGTNQDKRKYSQVTHDLVTPEIWEQRYAGDFMCKRIVNLVVEDALRHWVEWVGVDKQIAKKIDQKNLQLDLRGAIERSWKWARAYGGAVTYIVTDTNDPAAPLQVGERVIGLRDLSRYDLRILTTDIETDMGSPNFGYPRMYYLVVQVGSVFKGYPIHWTRMVRWDGALVPRRTFIRNNYWHDSVLNAPFEAIQDYQSSYGSMGNILQDFNVMKYKIKNFANLLQAGKESVVKSRIEMINYAKSVIRAMIMDPDDEDVEDMSRSVEGLAELLGKCDNRLVAATDIPHTKLLGESPDGSNATGNSTTNQWFDHVKGEQENYLKPRMKRLLDAIYYDIPDLDWKYRPLYQKTSKEEADERYVIAQTDQIYIQNEVLDPSEVTQSRFGGDQYSTEIQLDSEAREAGLIGPGMNGIDEPQEEGEEENESTNDNLSKKNDADLHIDPTKEAQREALAHGTKTESDVESPELPESLQPYTPNPRGVEVQNASPPFQMRDQQIVTKEKAKQQVSITMSEPFYPQGSPKQLRTGVPNQPRQVEKTRGNGITAPSGHEFRADAGEAAIMPEGLNFSKPGFVVDPPQRGDADEQPVGEASVIAVVSANRLLMGQRRESGKWTLPGGKIETGETAVEAALRELEEETGIKARASELNLVGSRPVQSPAGSINVHVFVLQTGQKPATSKNDPDNEVSKWRWVDVNKKQLPPSIANNLHHDPNVALEMLGMTKGEKDGY